MVNIDICGIDVDFPFEPYDCQKKYMEKVIQCLQKVIRSSYIIISVHGGTSWFSISTYVRVLGGALDF